MELHLHSYVLMARIRTDLSYFTLLYSLYKVTASVGMAVVKVDTTFNYKILSNFPEGILRYSCITDLNSLSTVNV